jgi:prepilin-type N-terminal cleavage/methylation domain-containing protein
MRNIKNSNTSNQKGFTIIEVMIVLAIAGLIMLIVFLAVPALQRNSRNTQYKSDAASILASASEFTNNNNGTIPVAADSAAILANGKTKSITGLTVATGTLTAVTPTFSTATLDTGVKCPASVSGTSVTPVQSATRAMALIYAVEKNDGTVLAQCTES